VRFAFIAEKAELGVTRLCRMLAVSRSGFYAWRKRLPSAHRVEDDRLRLQIREAHRLGRGVYGRPRIHRALRKLGVFVSRKRVARLMLAEGLVGRVRRRYRCTTMSDHDQPVAANILDQVFVAAGPNQRWVGDTTELVIPNGRLFLAVILDLFSRFVVGWALSAFK
jgi:putative transposase